MKIIKKLKISDFANNFNVKGSKKDLLLFEELLKENGKEDDFIWNQTYRNKDKCTVICVYNDSYTYFGYYAIVGECINVKEFL